MGGDKGLLVAFDCKTHAARFCAFRLDWAGVRSSSSPEFDPCRRSASRLGSDFVPVMERPSDWANLTAAAPLMS